LPEEGRIWVDIRHTYMVIKGIQRDIKQIDGEIAQRKEEVSARIKEARQSTENAIRHLPRSFGGPINPRTNQRVDPVWVKERKR
jgi:hypothetical protein